MMISLSISLRTSHFRSVRKFTAAAAKGAGPLEQYNKLVSDKSLKHDEHQERALKRLDTLHNRLLSNDRRNAGIYMHAGVGRGKTMIMDLFCTGIHESVKKQRVHYHEFMLQIHKKLYQNGGAKDPLENVATEIASQTKLLCVDELEITDVADAFVTRSLFEKLWKKGIVTVFTTNCLPNALYKGGINRAAFVPFIPLIEQYCEVICLDPPAGNSNGASGIDYRAAAEPLIGTTFCTDSPSFDTVWNQLVKSIRPSDATTSAAIVSNRQLRISQSRHITVPLSAFGVCRFTFAELCSTSFGNIDFLALTEPPVNPILTSTVAPMGSGGGYIAICLENIPIFSPSAANDTRRFINLIDLLYERHILLVMHAQEGKGMREPGDIFRQWVSEITGEESVEGVGKTRLTGHITNVPNNDGVAVMTTASSGNANSPPANKGNDSTFTHRAIARTISRLNEMSGKEYVKAWEKKNEKYVKLMNLLQMDKSTESASATAAQTTVPKPNISPDATVISNKINNANTGRVVRNDV